MPSGFGADNGVLQIKFNGDMFYGESPKEL